MVDALTTDNRLHVGVIVRLQDQIGHGPVMGNKSGSVKFMTNCFTI